MWTQYLIKINSYFLTSDGTETGVRYFSNIQGLDALQREILKVKRVDFRGNVYYELTDVGASNHVLTIQLLGVKFSLLDDLAPLQDEDEDVNLILTHPNNSAFTHSLTANIDSITWGAMLSDQFRDCAITLTTTGVYTP